MYLPSKYFGINLINLFQNIQIFSFQKLTPNLHRHTYQSRKYPQHLNTYQIPKQYPSHRKFDGYKVNNFYSIREISYKNVVYFMF